MHFTNLLLPTLGLLSAVASGAPSVSTSPAKPPQWPQSSEEFRKQHPFRYPPKNHRKVHHIRSSHNEHDDVSDELLKGIKAANNGGTLLLKKGKTYVIGKKLDLTFLNDFQMQLDGKILVGYLLWFGVRVCWSVVVHQQRNLLATASELLLPSIPKVNHFLEVGR